MLSWEVLSMMAHRSASSAPHGGPIESQLVVQIFTQVPVFHFHISPIDGDMRDCVPAPPKAQHHLLCLHHTQQQAVLFNIAWKQWKHST